MGCSSNPENIEKTNNQNEITEQTLTKVNKKAPKEPPNQLLTSNSTNPPLNSSYDIYKKKPKIYNINKKPQISPVSISKLSSVDKKEIYLIKVNACSFLKEELIPIWFEKDTYIKFITRAQWRIDSKYNYTDSKGMPTSRSLGFNYGAALARIGPGPKFVLPPNDFTYYNKFEGPLYLRMNLPKNIEVNPEGNMEVKVFDGTLMSFEEINSKIGWKEKNMNYSNKKSTDLENQLTTDINNLRMNPILFYENFIKNNSSTIWTEYFLKNAKFNNDNNQISPFSTNNDLYNSLKKFIKLNYVSIKSHLNKRGIDIYSEKLKGLIKVYLKDIFGCENMVDCRKTKKCKSEEICIQYVLDTNFRKNIFSSEYYSIAVNIIDNILPEEIFIILVFMKD